ncbi:hypothetical protein HPB50_014037 [Hyalomma asiaticum]|uniref:Uncharacterized protein n=1 Tax=Hyalomma asiaticum TaxID=266040 RepID=A0ACB7TKL5_HYAAI|nr:hypothetical protein HPB50_014037 [Hyalomma asiaticum]
MLARALLLAEGGDTFIHDKNKPTLPTNLGFGAQCLFYDLASQADMGTFSFQGVLEILDKHYKKNCLLRIFRERKRQPGETFEETVTVLHRLAPACDFGGWHAGSLRDRILQGVSSAKIRERLLHEGPTLKLLKVEEIGRSVQPQEITGVQWSTGTARLYTKARFCPIVRSFSGSPP